MSNIIIPDKVTPELAEETGWHIGDGSMNCYTNGNKIKGKYSLRGHKEVEKWFNLIQPQNPKFLQK